MSQEWIPFSDVNLRDETIKEIHIDTRDFCCSVSIKQHTILDTTKLLNYKDAFFCTIDEVNNIISDLYRRSGEKAKWRFLALEGEGKLCSNNWNLKYIRIYNTEYGFVICGNDKRAIKKNIFQCDVDKKILT